MKRPRGRDLVSRWLQFFGVVCLLSFSALSVAGTGEILQNCDRFLRGSDFAESSILPSVWHSIPAVKELAQREGFDITDFELQEPYDQKQKVSGPWLEYFPVSLAAETQAPSSATLKEQWNLFSLHKYHLVHKNRRDLKATMVFIWYRLDGGRDTNLQLHWQWENPRAVTQNREDAGLRYLPNQAKYYPQSHIHWAHVKTDQTVAQQPDNTTVSTLAYAPGSFGTELKLSLAENMDSNHFLRDPSSILEIRMVIPRKKLFPNHYSSGGLVPTDEQCTDFIAQLRNELKIEYLGQTLPLPKSYGAQDPLVVYWRLNWIQLMKLSLIAEELGIGLDTAETTP